MLPIYSVNTSFIDWPGRLSHVIAIQGCNLCCPFCYNPQLIRKVSVSQFDSDNLEKFRNAVSTIKNSGIKRVILTGGDPLAYESIDVLHTISTLKVEIADLKIGIHTNGMNPQTIHLLYEFQLVDFIALDIKTVPQKYYLLNNNERMIDGHPCSVLIDTSISLLKSLDIEKEFRITPFKNFMSQEEFDSICEMMVGYPFYINTPYQTNPNLIPYTDEELINQFNRYKGITLRNSQLRG